jgi:hypothetical protein
MPLNTCLFKRVAGVLVTLLPLLAFASQAGQAQTPVSSLFAAARAPAPSWVKPGLRLTYYMAVASLKGNGRDWKPDKNGNLVDAQGNHWSGEEKVGTGGHGYIQHDVVALDSRQAAVQQTNFMLNLDEPLTLLSIEGVLAPAGTGGELWVDPAQLKRLPDGMHEGYQIYRAPYRIGNANREGVWIHQESSGGTFLYVYDRTTGVLLHFASAGKAKKGPIIAPDEYENTSNVMMFQSTLADQRMLKLPWMADDNSNWVAHAGTLHFQGSAMTGSPGIPNSSARQNLTETITLQSHSTHWALFNATVSVGGGISSQVKLVAGSAQIGPFWIAPQTLAHLHTGQEIDRDPITGVITRVGPSSRAGETTITAVGGTFQLDFHYDTAHGDLIGIAQSEHHPYVEKLYQMSLHR